MNIIVLFLYQSDKYFSKFTLKTINIIFPITTLHYVFFLVVEGYKILKDINSSH